MPPPSADVMPPPEKENSQKIGSTVSNCRSDTLERHSKSAEALENSPREESSAPRTAFHTIQKATTIAAGTVSNARRPAMLGRTPVCLSIFFITGLSS